MDRSGSESPCSELCKEKVEKPVKDDLQLHYFRCYTFEEGNDDDFTRARSIKNKEITCESILQK